MGVLRCRVNVSLTDVSLTESYDLFLGLIIPDQCVSTLEGIRGCNVSPSPTDVSPTENSWMLHPLDKVSLG